MDSWNVLYLRKSNMAYSGIQYQLVNFSPQEKERLEKRADQELKISAFVSVPAVLGIGAVVFYCNTAMTVSTVLEIINGVGGIGGGILLWYFVKTLLTYK